MFSVSKDNRKVLIIIQSGFDHFYPRNLLNNIHSYLIERDPNNNIPPPVIGGYSPTIIGDEPPDFVRLDDICPQTVFYHSKE